MFLQFCGGKFGNFRHKKVSFRMKTFNISSILINLPAEESLVVAALVF